MNLVEIILYVKSQSASTTFYSAVLNAAPVLDVPGMTEFMLNEHCKLGLMPNAGIARILGDRLPHPDHGSGIPRCELYLVVDDLERACARAAAAGALLVSPSEHRDWGDRVAYFADPDGHVLALACKS
ncbi:MAG: VOC family protein [Bacteroidia bacterium]|nr:VOC family protein [Bacteroidia bacterium]